MGVEGLAKVGVDLEQGQNKVMTILMKKAYVLALDKARFLYI